MARQFSALICGLGLSVMLVLVSMQLTHAQEPAAEIEISEQKLQSIRSHCTQIKASLTQLHTTDALLRVNRGQTYTSISSNLMAKLNGRIALNRLDGAELVRITTQYEDHYEEFRQAYQEYSDEFEALRNIDCKQEPREFYQKLVEVRENRVYVNEVTKRLSNDITTYAAAFDQFRKEFIALKQKGTEVAGE